MRFTLRILGGGFCSLVLGCCCGCAHPSRMGVAGAFTLESRSGYSVLAPPATAATTSTVQTSTITLQSSWQRAPSAAMRQKCSITEGVFSIAPSPSGPPNLWQVTGLSVAGWGTAAGNLDVAGQWRRFSGKLAQLEGAGCFAKGQSWFDVRRAVAEAVAIPADQMLFYFYSLGNIGFVDLVPGAADKSGRPLAQECERR